MEAVSQQHLGVGKHNLTSEYSGSHLWHLARCQEKLGEKSANLELLVFRTSPEIRNQQICHRIY